ncbi:MAG: hypothetical protein PHI97_29900 [Desulfobulbus sp.]|nr:hypothetical protein [Desulfobulbus sp.]
MTSQPTHTGIYVGLFVGVIYLAIHAFKKEKPEFTKFATIILSCIGAVVSLDFGYIAITETDQNLGILYSQRVPMFLGALAVTWLAVERVLNIYCQLIKSENK